MRDSVKTQNATGVIDEWLSHFTDPNDLKEIRELSVDSSYMRTSASGEVYSMITPRNALRDFAEMAANTMPGKIGKLRGLAESFKMPSMHLVHSGVYNPILAAKVNTDKTKHYMEDAYMQSMDEFYKINYELGTVEREDKLTGVMSSFSGRYGYATRVARELAGDMQVADEGNWFQRYFDIQMDRHEYDGGMLQGLASRITKFANEEWRGNRFKRMFSPTTEMLKEEEFARKNFDREWAYAQVDDINRVQRMLKQNSYDLSTETLDYLESVFGKDGGTRAQELIQKTRDLSDRELVNEVIHGSISFGKLSELENKDLADILSRMANDNLGFLDVIYQKTDRAMVSMPGGTLFGMFDPKYNNETSSYVDILRAEIQKEAMLLHMKDSGGNYDDLVEILDNANLKGDNQKKLDRLGMLAILQDATDSNIREWSPETATENLFQKVDSFFSLTRGETERMAYTNKTSDKFKRTMDRLTDEEISVTESMVNEEYGTNEIVYDSILYATKSTTPLDLIRNMNEFTKAGKSIYQYGQDLFNGRASLKDFGNYDMMPKTLSDFFGQFAAGRDNLGDVTQSTFLPVFMLTRLSGDLNRLTGLGFSADSTSSLGAVAKNIALKRVMPVGLGLTAYDWLDDTTQAITGQSVSGTFAAGIGNVDLASRRVMDTFGISDWLKDEKAINPIMQYWGDHDDFMNYDERKKYYESGYDIERKGPWWTFGGVQEARGGEIQYFTPSFVRRIQSDYKDISLYNGSYFNKWSHSWIPNPTNPLSPIINLIDPYWLEDIHSEDRPYPLSGQLFQEGTPWGAVLNPTIGDIVKPQKEMHPWRLQQGVDAYALIEEINNKIHAMAKDFREDNIIGYKGTSLTPYNFVSYDAPTPDTKVSSIQYDPDTGQYISREGVYGAHDEIETNIGGLNSPAGSTGNAIQGPFEISSAPGNVKPYGFVPIDGNPNILLHAGEDGSDPGWLRQAILGKTNYPLQGDLVTDSKGNLGVYSTSDTRMTRDELEKAVDIEGPDFIYNNLKRIPGVTARHIISKANDNIKKQALTAEDVYAEEEGMLQNEKLSNFRPSKGMELLNNAEDVGELINASKGADFVRDASTSFRLIGGIYGYMGAEALGIGAYNDKRIATGQDIDSYARGFWDMNLGGFGGDVMEIARRFVPEFKRNNEINPLMNNLPDWLPERFRFGDALSAIPEGEARLPGLGYEALNDLHPDQFGSKYGAFDRYKILADIAPFTPEYKLWKNIAEKTVTDPLLREEMKEIRERVSKQRQKHDFYDYNVVGKGLDYQEVTVSEVLGFGRFRSGSTIYKIAGAKIQGNEDESMTEVFNRYIHAGQTVTVAVDDNQSYNKNKDAMQTVNAAVFVDGENVAEMMIESGDATRKKGDISTPATLARYSFTQRTIGYASELIAHADVPWLSDQFLRVRSPLESYKAEQVYGTPYMSWAHPIDTFLQPALERAVEQPIFLKAVARHIALNETYRMSKWEKNIANWGWAFADRGAFAGGAIANLVSPDTGNVIKKAARVSSDVTNVAHFLMGGTSMVDEATTGALIGDTVAKFMEKNRKIGAGIGAGVGIAYRGLFASKEAWIPERVQKNWELEDYFDRLTYLKYMGLYHAAAEKALDEEGVDVENLIDQQEKRTDLINGLKDKLEEVKKSVRMSHRGLITPEKNIFLEKINKKLRLLKDEETIEIHGGKYTHSAMIYKKAADATVYAMNKNSTWTEMVTALPTNDREYFMEFVKERDRDKRNEILNYASPFLRKALRLAWGEDEIDQESNASFFERHGLPDADWSGWRPDVDLKDVEVKTIENESMNLSDFGFYDSQIRDPKVIHAPELRNDADDFFSVRMNLQRILAGKGIKDLDINVVTANDISTSRIITDIGLLTGVRDMQDRVNTEMDNML